MKLAKRVSVLVLAGLLFFGGMFTTLNSNSYKEKQQVKEEIKIVRTLKEEDTKVDIEKKVLEDKISLTKGAIDSIKEDISINLLELSGEQRATLNLKPEQSKIGQYFADSKTTINLKYRTKYSIYTDKINMYVDSGNGALIISIDNEDIKVDGIVVDSYAVDSPDALFSKKLSEQQLFALVEKTSENIVDKMNENMDNVYVARKNLEKHIKELCKEMGVELISFDNGRSVERLNQSIQVMSSKVKIENNLPNKLENGIEISFEGNVKYGHPNSKRSDTKYIVIHSTSVNDSTARNHVKWLNSDDKSNAVHFYVDSSIVAQTLDLGLYSYGVGNGNNGITNNNSINIEMCQSSVMKYQLKTIENTKYLIKELKKIYGDDIEVVFHKQASSFSKNCPEIIYGKNPIMTEKELRSKLGI